MQFNAMLIYCINYITINEAGWTAKARKLWSSWPNNFYYYFFLIFLPQISPPASYKEKKKDKVDVTHSLQISRNKNIFLLWFHMICPFSALQKGELIKQQSCPNFLIVDVFCSSTVNRAHVVHPSEYSSESSMPILFASKFKLWWTTGLKILATVLEKRRSAAGSTKLTLLVSSFSPGTMNKFKWT